MPAPPEALPGKEEAPATTTLNGGGGEEEEKSYALALVDHADLLFAMV